MEALNQPTPDRLQPRRTGRVVLFLVLMASLLLGGLVAMPGASAQEKQDPELNLTYYLTAWGMEHYCESQGGILIENEHMGPDSGAYLCVNAWFNDRVILQCFKEENPKTIWRYFCFNNDWLGLPAPKHEPTAPPPVGELAEPDDPEANVVTDASHIIIMNGVAEELHEGPAEPDHGAAVPTTPTVGDTVTVSPPGR